METVKVKIKNTSNQSLPSYETILSAGMDIRAFVSENIVLNPLERKLVSTGLYIELPEGYEAQIRPRSGLAIKNGITVLNSPGTIDSDYRGEIKIILINLSTKPYVIGNGERIAQMIVAPHSKVEWTETDELEETIRGDKGFGHTGVQ